MKTFTNPIVIVFLLAVFAYLTSQPASATRCAPGDLIWYEKVVLEMAVRTCPCYAEICEYRILENRHSNTKCISEAHQTVLNLCRIRESLTAPPHLIPWSWPEWLGVSTLRGPCFPPIASTPCDDNYNVTTWYQWIEFAKGIECDVRWCFSNCEEGEIPECGLQDMRCPNE